MTSAPDATLTGVDDEFDEALDDAAAADGSVPPDADAVERRRARVDARTHGLRLDKLLVTLAGEFSRSHLQHLIEAGHVQVDARVATQASRKVTAGQQVEVALWPTAQSTAFRPEPMALAIVHEDEHLLVIDKPAGLVVHPAAGHWSGTLLNGLLAHHVGAAQLPRAGIVHRLDKDTSGLMLVARTLVAQTALVRAIADRSVHREYVALVHGDLAGSAPGRPLRIDAAIGRDPVSRVKMALLASGKPAMTDVLRLGVASLPIGPGGTSRPVSAVHCKLHTGRTHQIRVHLTSRGHPLLADAMYGGAPALGLARQALHAARLSLAHPVDGRALVFEAPLPSDIAQAWPQVCGQPFSRLPSWDYNPRR
ncbi:RluA family pseudouridine synthase [Leptothrix discophora]|uniref:Pseudouridine synthase n=1 Tax=Leptothrix discophora TaxID=89 RepID=A0ABT9G0W4_LEPDI|nr:RluA family pseudouridine synthase [Leptothrix discophora]MDP4300129.1 RluA family pseudouridine synthase [Leptothrix discophora]